MSDLDPGDVEWDEDQFDSATGEPITVNTDAPPYDLEWAMEQAARRQAAEMMDPKRKPARYSRHRAGR